jgi:cation diffusion facilitator CzcD-associated flavoprotein CzcO
VTVDRLERSESGDSWTIRFHSKTPSGDLAQETEQFERVIVTSGAFSKAFMPKFEGLDKFKGQVMHVQAYKE